MIINSNCNNNGRLGNQLFQIAATIGTSLKNNTDYLLPIWQNSEYFEYPFFQSHYLPGLPVYNEPNFYYNEIIGNNIDLSGYFQSAKYWSGYEKEIKQQFEFKKEIVDKVNHYYCDILKQKTVSVHVRRTDYIEQYLWHHNLTIEDYYLPAFKYFSKDCLFLIFSDDPGWCFDNIQKNPVFCEYNSEVIHESEIEDLVFMSLCSGNIIANSSFSWWGAYLNKNEPKVIAPIQWFGINYSSQPRMATMDLIPENWIRI